MIETSTLLDGDQGESTGLYRFAELGDKAKEHARREYRDRSDYLEEDWWDSVYEDFFRVASILGVNINFEMNRRSVFFTLHVQGAGACYEGRYAYSPNAVERIKEHAPNDAELLRIAEQLTIAQTTARLLFGDTFIVSAQVNGRATNAYAMRMAWRVGDGAMSIGESPALMDTIEKCLHDLADWLYKQLQEKYDYLMSDEVIDRYLAEMAFTGDGEEVT